MALFQQEHVGLDQDLWLSQQRSLSGKLRLMKACATTAYQALLASLGWEEKIKYISFPNGHAVMA